MLEQKYCNGLTLSCQQQLKICLKQLFQVTFILLRVLSQKTAFSQPYVNVYCGLCCCSWKCKCLMLCECIVSSVRPGPRTVYWLATPLQHVGHINSTSSSSAAAAAARRVNSSRLLRGRGTMYSFFCEFYDQFNNISSMIGKKLQWADEGASGLWWWHTVKKLVQETCTSLLRKFLASNFRARKILYKKPCQTVKFLVLVDLYTFLVQVSWLCATTISHTAASVL